MLARNYADRMVSNSLGSTTDIAKYFLDAGWKVAEVQEVEVKGELVPTTYARFVARRV